MGTKRPSTRTLPSGEQIEHRPGGDQYLIPTTSLAAVLAHTEADMRAAAEKLTAQRLSTIEAKRESLASGDEVPGEKRAV
jgi:hypothetical protein